MIIRKCETKDIERCGEFYDKVVAYLDAHINYPKWMYKQYPSVAWAKEMTAEGSQYICLEGDDIVCAFVLNTDPQGNYEKGHWSQTLDEGSYLILHALAVDPACQGQGVGAEVLKWCEAYATDNGFKALRIDIVPSNTPAQRLYEKNGYTFAGEVDLDRGYEHIPTFCLYEKNLSNLSL